MATILKSNEREFKEDPNKIDNFRLFSDLSRKEHGVVPQNLNFDLRMLNPGQCSFPYHFHRFAEELIVVLSGTMTLRTPGGFEVVESGDLIFFEVGESGAHQFRNQGNEPCTYLDIRTFNGYDVCEYPDTGKILMIPSLEVYRKSTRVAYFDGEENVLEKWEQTDSQKNLALKSPCGNGKG